MDHIDPEVHNLIRKGKKIKAIKRLRELTGMGLKEAKDYVDNWGEPASPPVGISPETLEFEVRELIRQGRKVMAVKRVRELTGMGLKEAKDYVDSLAR